ncbi:MAG TPA: hypothetical protein VHC69_32020 [Polyangiaceae bacterium]|nr:hypothetical protein [Polyangiaceae bacterium]
MLTSHEHDDNAEYEDVEINVSPALHAELIALAEQENVSLSELVQRELSAAFDD